MKKKKSTQSWIIVRRTPIHFSVFLLRTLPGFSIGSRRGTARGQGTSESSVANERFVMDRAYPWWARSATLGTSVIMQIGFFVLVSTPSLRRMLQGHSESLQPRRAKGGSVVNRYQGGIPNKD